MIRAPGALVTGIAAAQSTEPLGIVPRDERSSSHPTLAYDDAVAGWENSPNLSGSNDVSLLLVPTPGVWNV